MAEDNVDGQRERLFNWSRRLCSEPRTRLAQDGRVARPFSLCTCGIALVVTFVVDSIFARYSPSLPVAAVLDESAHLATAVLVLSALRRPLPSALVVGMLFGSVAIDVDHIPLVLGWHVLTEGTSRPYPHSWISPAIAAAMSSRLPGRARIALQGVAVGFLIHFLRDAATGDGFALLWPFTSTSVRTPYWCYAALLLMVGARSAVLPLDRNLSTQ